MFLDEIKNLEWERECDIPETCGAMTVQIGFTHKEMEDDETEFCINAWDADELAELFKNFCEENHFEELSVCRIGVVRTASSLEELTAMEEVEDGSLDAVINSCEEMSKKGDCGNSNRSQLDMEI